MVSEQIGECPFVPTTTHLQHTSFIPQQLQSSGTVFPAGPDTVSLITTGNITQKRGGGGGGGKNRAVKRR